MKWRLRSCPRCGGDMFIDRDLYGWYKKCLQCGYCGGLKGLDEFGHDPALAFEMRQPALSTDKQDRRNK